jgi:hypothetical protein
MTYLTDLEQLIACAPLPSLRGYASGSVRAVILDACDSGKVGAADALQLSRQCDHRIDTEGVQFGHPRRPEPSAPAAEPSRAPLPPPLILEDRELVSCSQRRWSPDEPIRIADTAWEQLSRLENYALAIELTDLQSCDDQWDQRRKDAIWAAVCIELELTMAARGLRLRKEVASVA